MIRPLHPIEIFLQPGDYYFAGRDTRIRTVLGSCVSMTFWHPQLLVGGMCHYMLPGRRSERRAGDWPVPNGRFADEAVALLLSRMDRVGTPHQEYQVKLFGGGDMFPETNQNRDEMPRIGVQNVQAARRLAKKYSFTCVAEHLGGIGHRTVIFDVWNGEVWVKHSEVMPVVGHGLANRRLG
ncbi:MAG: chemotaxis protein CheD [Methylobacter sp.]|nr:chemotaxis protein CheD [Methylobacter sp.]MDP2098644.1 chemotaxis protein CheD [Methylobacter sp.]MDP2429851.1 chemotaxis protein CheD [Methylobacter sp.]MDP3054756.1 chemotaxis protein CheD [Methylobacter sp.]MDP3362212.1 chemotaxis protein CheD [Methylobacter sp.]